MVLPVPAITVASTGPNRAPMNSVSGSEGMRVTPQKGIDQDTDCNPPGASLADKRLDFIHVLGDKSAARAIINNEKMRM